MSNEPNLEELSATGLMPDGTPWMDAPETDFFGKEPEQVAAENVADLDRKNKREARWLNNKNVKAKLSRKFAHSSLKNQLTRLAFTD